MSSKKEREFSDSFLNHGGNWNQFICDSCSNIHTSQFKSNKGNFKHYYSFVVQLPAFVIMPTTLMTLINALLAQIVLLIDTDRTPNVNFVHNYTVKLV